MLKSMQETRLDPGDPPYRWASDKSGWPNRGPDAGPLQLLGMVPNRPRYSVPGKPPGD